MTITGTVDKVVRRRTSYGCTYATVTIDGRPWKFLADFVTLPKKGDRVTLDGVPLIGFKRTNVGAVRLSPA